jgi:tetratricopeptide (TPR) repeat protein
MKRTLAIFLVASTFFWALPAEAAALAEARQRWLRGNYAEAQELYRTLLAGKESIPASIGLSRALESVGEYDDAQQVIEKALKDSPNNTDLLSRHAQLLYLRGRWAEAEKAADKAVADGKEPFLAHWIRVRLYMDRGDLDKADQEYRWFIRTYVRRDNNDDPIKDPEHLVLVGLAGLVNARRHSLSDQFRFILNEVYADAIKYDKDYWPAEYEAGILLLEKYNRGEALNAFDKVLTINPNAAQAYVGKGIAALRKFEIKQAETFAERALKVNPRLPSALQLRADIHLMVGDVPAALRELETARKVSPRAEATLGRIAACHLLNGQDKEMQALAKEVASFDSKPAVFYLELGERLEERRRFNEAMVHLRKARELRPDMAGPANSLGMLYMRLGNEEEAQKTLDEGFHIDPFNVRVSNLRKVLRHLSRYDTLKTEHFRLRYDPAKDAVLARYLADYLETVYAHLAQQFDYRPVEPILIEVFNNHEMFSGRTIALPDLHTIGACTGRVIAMVSPEGRGIPKPFNWGRVIRHELVHLFNLEQTNFQVPHWLTEGLAVRNEGFPRPQIWNELLKERVPAGELLKLDNIQLSFIRPRSPLDWQMAYCQSELYIEYLVKKYGEKAIGQLLAAYAEGLSTDAVIRRVCKVSKEDFEKDYRAYLEEVVRSLGGKNTQTEQKTLAELKAAHEKDQTDPDVAAELGYRLLSKGDVIAARQLAEKALERKKNHPRALYVLSQLARRGGDVQEQQKLLERAVDSEDPDPVVLRALGKIYYDASEFDKAAETFELGRKAEPFNSKWLEELARVRAQQGDKGKLIAILKELVPTNADEFAERARLARLLAEEGQHAEAEKYARQALEINVRDADVQAILLQALRAQKKNAEADRLQRLLGR